MMQYHLLHPPLMSDANNGLLGTAIVHATNGDHSFQARTIFDSGALSATLARNFNLERSPYDI